MDPVEQAKALLRAIADGTDPAPFLHPRISFRSDRGLVLDRDGLQAHFADREGTWEMGDVMAKRNVVIAAWEHAPSGESGTWFLSIDREGLVTEWAEIVAP